MDTFAELISRVPSGVKPGVQRQSLVMTLAGRDAQPGPGRPGVRGGEGGARGGAQIKRLDKHKEAERCNFKQLLPNYG